MKHRINRISKLIFSVLMLATLMLLVLSINASAATLTVPTDYGTIQAAIDTANSGDTVFVKAGTYYENLIIQSKSIALQGEDKTTTIIDGSGTGSVIKVISTNDVTISDLTAINSGMVDDGISRSGIEFQAASSYNTVKNVIVSGNVYGINNGDQFSQHNTFENIEAYSNNVGIIGYMGSDYMKVLNCNVHDNNQFGVAIGWSSYWTIENTIVSSNYYHGIAVDTASYGTIRNCESFNNRDGILIHGLGNQNNNLIVGNKVYSNERGLFIANYDSNTNTVKENQIYDNSVAGIWLQSVNNNLIFNNNFQNPTNVIFYSSSASEYWDNGFSGNYWSDYTGIDSDNNGIGDVSYTMNEQNIDHYPLMEPWSGDMLPETNHAPVAYLGESYRAAAGSEITFDASSSTDPDGDALQYRWDFESDGTWDTEWSNDPTATHTWNDDWSGTTTVEVNDGELTNTDIASVIVTNVAPAVEAGEDQIVDEGVSVSISPTFNDAENADTHTAIINWGDGSAEAAINPATSPLSGSHIYADNGVYTVTLTVTDDDGGISTDTLTVTVNNVDPVVGDIISPLDPREVNTQVAVSSTLSDVGILDTHKAVWNWGDGTTSAGIVVETNGAGTVTGEHAYATTGIYWVTLAVTDDDGGSASVASEYYIVIYDSEGGFVTGGGWIDSPAGAYVPDTTLTGKATFGFVSKYLKGATVPTGNTEFQFKVANLNFKSTSYDWLVVAGAQAKYKGTGTINGVGEYGFMLSAVDGVIKGDNIDKFRIKIWDKTSGAIVYDNEIGVLEDAEPSTAIDGGSIVVHKLK